MRVEQNENQIFSRDLGPTPFDTTQIIDYVSSVSISENRQLLCCAMAELDDDLDKAGREIQARIKDAMRRYREEKGVTQRDMAAWLQISHKSYSSYESRSDRDVPIALIVRFCDWAGIDLFWILRGIPPAIPVPPRSSSRRSG